MDKAANKSLMILSTKEKLQNVCKCTVILVMYSYNVCKCIPIVTKCRAVLGLFDGL